MARITKSPLGEFSGRVGAVVFKTGKNGNYISERPTPTTKKPSEVQQLQRNKMTVVMEFMILFQRVFRTVYFPFQQKKSGFHAAKSHYLKEAVVLENGKYTIDYSKALLSYGDLRMVENLQLTPDADNHSITIQWTDNSNQAMAYPDDELIVVCYSPETNDRYFLTNLAQRAAGQVVCNLGNLNTPTEFHIWVGFHQPEKQRASPSVYGGKVVC